MISFAECLAELAAHFDQFIFSQGEVYISHCWLAGIWFCGRTAVPCPVSVCGWCKHHWGYQVWILSGLRE